MKAILIDTETTGLDPVKNGVIQIAGQILVNQAVVETFDYLIQPLPDDIVVEEAMQVHGHSLEDLSKNGMIATEAKKEFEALLSTYVNKFNKSDKFLWYGYNAIFDYNFVRQWFNKMGDKYLGSWFFFPPIDIMGIAAYYLRRERSQLKNFKLTTVAQHLGVELDGQAHDALYDVKLTHAVISELEGRLIKRMRLDAQALQS